MKSIHMKKGFSHEETKGRRHKEEDSMTHAKARRREGSLFLRRRRDANSNGALRRLNHNASFLRIFVASCESLSSFFAHLRLCVNSFYRGDRA